MTLQTVISNEVNEQCIMDCTLCDPINQLQEQSEEQAKKMGEQSEQLAGEVASLREALEKLVTQMAAK